jgi:Rrf2 family protein
MFRPSKVTQHAIAAISRLAEVYADPEVWLTATDIADARQLRKHAMAKVLSEMTRVRLVQGSPGPGGGYRLAKHPGDITMWEIYELFEHQSSLCPYGPDWCGNQTPCPLHDSLSAMQSALQASLRALTFEAFTRRTRPERQPVSQPNR